MSSLPTVIPLCWALSLAAAGLVLVVVRVRALVFVTEMRAVVSGRSRANAGVSPLDLNR